MVRPIEVSGCTLAVGTSIVVSLDIVAIDGPGVTTANFLAATGAMDCDDASCAAVAGVAVPGLEAGCGGEGGKDG